MVRNEWGVVFYQDCRNEGETARLSDAKIDNCFKVTSSTNVKPQVLKEHEVSKVHKEAIVKLRNNKKPVSIDTRFHWN